MTKPLIIELRANENAGRDPNRNVPWTPDELAADIAACCEAGASITHYHGRTIDGAPAHDPETYAAIAREVRSRCDILLAPSLANTPGASAQQRIANLAPGLGSADFLAIEPGSVCMDLYDWESHAFRSTDRLFLNTTETVTFMADKARSARLMPYVTSFNVTWTRALHALVDAGIVQPPFPLLFVTGGPGFLAAHPGSIEGLQAHLAFLGALPGVEWLVCCHGASVLAMAEYAIAQGGHVAIGLGDHPYEELGLPTNADLVRHIAELGRRYGREPARPAWVKALFTPTDQLV
ncbi:beta-keto acid cleavage family enzyme [Chelatococcus asaccharovorans]|uniref:3-keto-5-aminohexanoate cleavage protein n=1 Tax=Chelatococcus asaccharovorans TaxID=28210 RepID=UPI00224C74E1|nr:3-keto-5-aminohexanoate cleavage protein [Chelatococcus asaccharovorans]CAH1660128.1 putative 3-keto-5-aminohexanoate cleavage enzyme [Chelatococcus asaccharovorans]CAH1683925.1 putative 3-keto-5-aminohexanoate cleavage enzyme [Chelatococcus asaccharovorans]